MECTVGSCGHLHATSDPELARTVLSHTRDEHPETPMSEWTAEALVERTSYDDRKHAKDGKHWSEGMIVADVGGGPGIG